MKQLVYICFLAGALSFFGCKKEGITTHDVVQITIGNSVARTDGTTETKITASIPAKALNTERQISFITSAGNFRNGSNGMLSLAADDENAVSGKLSAIAYLVSPIEAGSVTVSAGIESYRDSLLFQFSKIPPATLTTTSDVLAVKVNYVGVVNLTTQLTSSVGGLTSKGLKIRYTDRDANNNPVNGTFQPAYAICNEKSVATVKYSPGFATPGSYIFLKAIYVDDNGIDAGVKDSIKIYLLNSN